MECYKLLFDKSEPINITNKIETNVNAIKKSLDKVLKPLTTRHNNIKQGYIYPPLHPSDCRFILNNYPMLNAIVNVLANDIVLNEFNFYIHEQESMDFFDIDQFWINNKIEIRNAVKQDLGYGYGVCEIQLDNQTLTKPTKLKQIDCKNMVIVVKQFNGRKYYYAEYRKQNQARKLFRITREDYEGVSPLEDKSEGYVIWFGGDDENEWYSKPAWSAAYLDITTAMKKKELDYNVISDGNVPKGALFIKAPPAHNMEGEVDNYTALKRHFAKAGGGVAISYLETPVNDIPMTTEYVNLQDDNYEYLNSLIMSTDDLIFSIYRVPKIRLMVYNGKSRNNDEDTARAYEIYTIDLSNYQLPVEQEIDIVNEFFFNTATTCDIRTPVFADTTQTEVQTIIEMYNVGIITLKEAISMITPLYPDTDWSDVDFTDPELHQRFYHGMVFSIPGVDTGMEGLMYENMRGGLANGSQFHPDATPEELHLPTRSLFRQEPPQ